MKRSFSAYPSSNSLSPRNWESDIREVLVESCDNEEDPLGYHAVFYLTKEAAKADERKSFVIGASFLDQRKKQLSKAGYCVPMTKKAISLIEEKMGTSLSEDSEVV